MTEERIGGISVGIGGSLSELEAVIAKAESMVQDSAKRMGAVADGYFSPSGRATGGGSRGGGGAGSAANEQLVHAINTLTQQLQQQKFGGGGGRRGGQQSYEDALDELLTKHGNTPYGRAVAQAAGQQGGRMAGETRPAESFRPIPSVNANVREMRVQASSASLDVDMSSFTEMLGKATSGLTELAAALAHVPPTSTAASSGGGGSSRRARISRAAPQTGVYTAYPDEPGERPVRSMAEYAERSRREAIDETKRLGARVEKALMSNPRRSRYPGVPEPLAAGPESYSDAPLRTQPMTDNDRRRPRLNTRMASSTDPNAKRGTPPPTGGSILGLSELDELFSSGEISRILGGQMARQIAAARITRQGEAAQISREAEVLTQGRTARTGASSLAGFLFGGRRGETEAKGRLTVAEQDVQSATRYKSIFDRIILDKKIDADLGSKTAKQQMLAIQNSRVYKAAEDQVAEAEGKRAAALKDVEKFTQGALPAARNLLAITVGGAAFGLGLEAFSKATEMIGSGLAPAINRAVDANSNFSASNTQVTASLAQQTAALQGNAKGAILSAAALSNVSSAQADYLTSALSPETMVKAGTAALSQGASLFKAAAGAGTGTSTQGLIGGYGGILGTPVFGSQLGGGQGFMETLAQNLQDFATAAAKAPPGAVEKSYTENTPSGQYQISSGPTSRDITEANAARAARDAYISSLTDATKRGAGLTGQATGLSIQALKPGESGQSFIDAAAKISTQAGGFAKTMAESGYVLKDAFGNIASSGSDLATAFTDMAAGLSTPDLSTVTKQAQVMSSYNENIREAQDIGSRQAALQQVRFEQQKARPAFLDQLFRSSNLAIGQQNPVGAYLENLANPPIAAGAGIALSGKDDAATRRRVQAGIAAAEDSQKTLNAYYEQGRQIIDQTYKPAILATFGQAGAQVFDGLLNKAAAVSQQIQTIETGVTQEQAAYATHQYENDLRIAKRSLTDILQLTGQIGAAGGDNLGVYERQNLLLGRQAQQLSFMLSQRQINFQTAIAGFQVPGLTPAEQNARVEEAKIEASYAQKQLDIQKKMFGNQVKIVDIGNLRQATDLMHQIGLLQEGRKVTLDTAAAQAQLTRLNKQQAALQKDISVYTSAVDSLSQKAISDMAEQEQAVGHAISAIEAQSVKAAYNVGHALFLGISGGFLGGGGASAGFSTKKPPAGNNSNPTQLAGGALFNTMGPTDLTVGEANGETVAVLRNPRSMSPGGFGGGGGDIVINLTATLDGQVIYKDVVRRQGRDAALRGLRGIN